MIERPLDDDPAADAAPETDHDEPTSRRRSRWVTVGIPVAAVIVAAGLVGGIVLASRGSGATSTSAANALHYGTVTQTTVAQTQSLSGTLAYAATQTITNRFTPSATTASIGVGSARSATLAAFVTTAPGAAGTSTSTTTSGSTGASGSGSSGKSGSGSSGKSGSGSSTTSGSGSSGKSGSGASSGSGSGASSTAAASGGSSSSSSSSSTASSATLTTVAAVGAPIKVGATLYTVNEQPVIAMYGSVPAYRNMQSGDTGTDITQLQRSLAELGYNPGSTDGTFGSATLTAVEDWQKADGLSVTGVVDLGQVVFIGGTSRVIAQLATVGDATTSGTQIMTIGPESPIVTTSESSTQLGLLTQGQTVEVQLPDNSIVPGKVTSVGGSTGSSSSSGSSGGSGGGSGASSSSTAATVALNNPALGNSIAGSSVNVIVTTDSVRNVLAVPLGALLATSTGQFIVQVPTGSGTLSDVKVNPTVYDDTRGIVAVPSANLTPGERVVVAAT